MHKPTPKLPPPIFLSLCDIPIGHHSGSPWVTEASEPKPNLSAWLLHTSPSHMSVLNTLCVIPMENECTHTTIVGHFYSNINDVTFEKIHSNFSEDIINLVVKSQIKLKYQLKSKKNSPTKIHFTKNFTTTK